MSKTKTAEDFGIVLETVTAPTNIACIKYWGKASLKLNTPINSSVSVTLDQTDLRAVTTVATSKAFTSHRLWLNGEEEDVASSKRIMACIEGVRRLATDRLDEEGQVVVSKEAWNDLYFHVSSMNTFPTAAGLASSAAGYAALVFGLSQLMQAKETYEGELSTIARQGSGSACRSLYGGFVAWDMGADPYNSGHDSRAVQICPETHWPELRALILVVSDLKKDTSSTAGMTTSVATSELLAHRAASVVPARMEKIKTAFLERDFETFGQLTMQDSNQFHATCLDTYPPIFYLNDVSRSVIRLVHAYNAHKGKLVCAYTFDAGPNAVLYTTEPFMAEILTWALTYYPAPSEAGLEAYTNNPSMLQAAKATGLEAGLAAALSKTGLSPAPGNVKMMYCTKMGPGPQRLSTDEALLDPATGLNRYTK